jgi:hypothetical protein
MPGCCQHYQGFGMMSQGENKEGQPWSVVASPRVWSLGSWGYAGGEGCGQRLEPEWVRGSRGRCPSCMTRGLEGCDRMAGEQEVVGARQAKCRGKHLLQVLGHQELYQAPAPGGRGRRNPCPRGHDTTDSREELNTAGKWAQWGGKAGWLRAQRSIVSSLGSRQWGGGQRGQQEKFRTHKVHVKLHWGWGLGSCLQK